MREAGMEQTRKVARQFISTAMRGAFVIGPPYAPARTVDAVARHNLMIALSINTATHRILQVMRGPDAWALPADVVEFLRVLDAESKDAAEAANSKSG